MSFTVMAPNPVRAVLTAVQSQDDAQPQCFERFLGEQRDALVGFLRLRTTGEAEAQDAAQESLLRLMRYRHGQPAEAWKPLLYRIAVNVVHDLARRKRSHHSEAHHSLDDQVQELPADEPSHEQRIATQQELALIRELILLLPPRCRQVYLLNRIEGMSYLEIARHCGISVKAVEKHISKALGELRRGLGESGHSAFQEP